ncbi:corrinoid protein [Christensenella tenuis]|jgi:corrinoid protein of di/trimethylamine methyltransferase|uniref:Corrinoid protein n=1 Tax=Christensenella tenuis TaxID=2763033 RepID=A0ABR7ECV2_9FIRM|nr:corrinoid protein [Christensenella tenuis]MBC5647008.1 corrinoid protein [Christensenella tenuis]
MSVYEDLSTLVQQGRANNVKEIIAAELEKGTNAQDLLQDGLLVGMSIIGEKFKNNQVYVPEVLIAARAMQAGIDSLAGALASEKVESKGKVVLGTVKGDLHDIGKNLVKIMLESKGLDVIDLGVDVSAEKFVDTAIAEGAQVIACSALLTTTMAVMKEVVDEVNAKGVKDKIKVMVGGAPVTEDFKNKIGADYYTADASSASDVALQICQ